MVGTESLPHYEAEAKKRMQIRKGDQAGASVAIVPPLIESAKARDQAAAAVGVRPVHPANKTRQRVGWRVGGGFGCGVI